MERIIKCKRVNKDIYIEDNKCYKVFEEGYNRANILNEALIHARVEETDLNIPHLYGVMEIDDRWAIVMENIEGKTIDKLLLENPEKADELLNKFVDIQLEVQSKNCPLLSKYRDKMNRKVDDTDLSATLKYDLHNRIEAMPRHNYLCHGDFNPSNVIISNDNKAYVIDWSHATQGNRAADAARTFLLFLLNDKEKKYAKKYLELYCQKTGVNYKVVLTWLPILAASQSVKGKKDESELLYKLIFMSEESLEELYDQI